MMLGLVTGCFLGGRLADRFGRKKTMFSALFNMIFCIAIAGAWPNFFWYSNLRLVSGKITKKKITL
jgi:MFS family permease